MNSSFNEVTELQLNLPLVNLMLLTCSIGINFIPVSFQMKKLSSAESISVSVTSALIIVY